MAATAAMSFACRPPAFDAVGAVVSPLLGGLAFAAVVSPSSASAAFRFRSDGAVDAQNDNVFELDVQRWFSPLQVAVGSAYYIRATLVTGDTPSGTLNAWLSLSSNRTWTLLQSGIGSKQCQLTIQIASDAAGSNIITTGQYSLQASVEI